MLIGVVKKGQSLFILSFLTFVFCGMLILKLPWCYRAGELAWSDALFMATSAVCVNGLSVLPIENFTLFGQTMILLMVEIGGIGIMTLSASILLMLGGGLSFSDTLMISSLSDNFSLRGTEGLTRTVVTYTLVSEAVGMVLMLPGFLEKYGWAESLWYSLFHAVTGFCNAGLSPFEDSLAGQSPLVQFAVGALVILGGLGVYVIYDLLQLIRRREIHLRVHSKVVLLTNLILIAGGAVLIWFFGVINDRWIGWFDALFLSVSSRTAGFTTFDIAALPASTTTLIIIFMLIGASPGSTGGGMKTSTVAVAAAAIFNTFKGNPEVLMFRRRVPAAQVLRAFTIIVMFTLLACVAAMAIQMITPGSAMMEAFFRGGFCAGNDRVDDRRDGQIDDGGKTASFVSDVHRADRSVYDHAVSAGAREDGALEISR
ncbi:MAG: potassium transporter [Lentisphaeria bacterium]|nr:MAG: potassium transporter [Lentisphaeria bacterium]